MFSWISSSALPSSATIDWLFEVFAWLLGETGGYGLFRKRTRLVLPTDEFFPVSANLKGHALAKELFEATRHHAGMSQWSCIFEEHYESPSMRDLVGDMPFRDPGSRTAAGVFHRRSGTEPKITYAPSGLSNPTSFVATLAHELGHFRIDAFGSPPPGGYEALEPATDVCAVFLGFAVFQANSAFTFEQFNEGRMHGWSTKSLGYLDEISLSYALAIFLALQELELGVAKSHLKTNPRTYAKHALRHITKERSSDLAHLRTIGDGNTVERAEHTPTSTDLADSHT